MQNNKLILSKIKLDYPQFKFEPSSSSCWSPSENTIYFDESDEQPLFLLHELSHAILEHKNYEKDVQLVFMERQAWDKAIELSSDYGIDIPNSFIEQQIDSYRDWLHDRSTCPSCQATGFQIGHQKYSCPACTQTWRVNEARTCGLKRYAIKT